MNRILSGISPRLLTVSALILIAALSRLLPHWPNFTAVAAMGLFGGTLLQDRRLAIATPLIAMFISDLFLGFHSTMPFTYSALLLTTLIGMGMLRQLSAVRILGASLTASVVFFVISNFGVWLTSGGAWGYTQDLQGLLTCYLMAIPFFHYSLLGDLFFSAVLFGGFALLSQRFNALRA